MRRSSFPRRPPDFKYDGTYPGDEWVRCGYISNSVAESLMEVVSTKGYGNKFYTIIDEGNVAVYMYDGQFVLLKRRVVS